MTTVTSGFAWKTSEWALTPDTFDVTHDDAVVTCGPAVPARGGYRADAFDDRSTPTDSDDGSLGSGSGCASVSGDSASGRQGKAAKSKRPASSPRPPRLCDAEGCQARVLNRTQGEIVLCPLHRRDTSGVVVAASASPVRWCCFCKKVHELHMFANSIIGESRKLSTCERGVRRGPSFKGRVKSKSQSPPASASAMSGPGGVAKAIVKKAASNIRAAKKSSSVKSRLSLSAEEHLSVNEGRWVPSTSGVKMEFSVDAHPINAAKMPVWSFVQNTMKSTFGNESVADAVTDDGEAFGGSEPQHSGDRSFDSLSVNDARSTRSLLGFDNDAVPSWFSGGAAATEGRSINHDDFDNLLANVTCDMLPGSTRLVMSVDAPIRDLGGFAREAPSAADVATSLPRDGVIGSSIVTVSAQCAGQIGVGWKENDDQYEVPGGDTITMDTSTLTPLSRGTKPMTLIPRRVKVSPIVRLGEPLYVEGLHGNDRVHVFGQGLAPLSIVVPQNCGEGRLRIDIPVDEVDCGAGFVSVQVLKPGRSASGSEFIRVLIVDDDDVADELDALQRGTGASSDAFESILEPIECFYDSSSFELFLADFGWLLGARHRRQLYTPSARATTRNIASLLTSMVHASHIPAISALLRDVLDEIDDQEEHEKAVKRETKRAAERCCDNAPVFSDDEPLPMDARTGVYVHITSSKIVWTVVPLFAARCFQNRSGWDVTPGTVFAAHFPSLVIATMTLAAEYSPSWYDAMTRWSRETRVFFGRLQVFMLMLGNCLIGASGGELGCAELHKFILFTILHAVNVTVLSVTHAENAPMSAIRVDIAALVFLHHALVYAIHWASYGGRFVDLPPPAGSHVYFALSTLCVYACATFTRAYYRRHLRSVRMIRLGSKSKKIE